MARKKWTPQTDVTDAVLRFREKKKWQLGYRRYVLERMPSEAYAQYFGLGVDMLREWFELQFTEGISWDNFGKAWQFYHIIPTNYFDFSSEEDLVLCWSFINIGIEKLEEGEEKNSTKIDALTAKAYFQQLHTATGYSLCLRMIEKIQSLESGAAMDNTRIENFLVQNGKDLESIRTLEKEEFLQLNQGSSLQDLLLEREILKKFGTGK
jgi:hypothetical protein